ncbi:GAF domain-containing protein [Allokutzneria oryzae]|uniref:GAF domain-containing protein n=1 Tax=Allokutzneria oryzae TaxID=1378989 RepID=A0ABV5ZPV5_9PSEU
MTRPAFGEDDGTAWQRVAAERERAARAATIAARHEVRLRECSEPTREFHRRMATLHRDIEQRHQAAAKLHEVYAGRLRKWRELGLGAAAPAFMTAVAETTGSNSVVVTLFDSHRTEALVAVSDHLAETAHDLEATFGEGPMRDAVAQRRLVTVRDNAFERRWPLFGPAMLQAGVHMIAAAPMGLTTECLGALAVFHPEANPRPTDVSLDTIAEALTHTILSDPGTATGDGMFRLPLFGDADHLPVVNQAAGVVAVEYGCDIPGALALIRAHAFTNGELIEVVAAKVLKGLRFGGAAE